MMRGLRSCVYTVIFFFYFLQANKLSVAANFCTKRNSDAHLNSKYRTMPQHSVIKFNDTAILFVTLPACRRANALNLPSRCVGDVELSQPLFRHRLGTWIDQHAACSSHCRLGESKFLSEHNYSQLYVACALLYTAIKRLILCSSERSNKQWRVGESMMQPSILSICRRSGCFRDEDEE